MSPTTRRKKAPAPRPSTPRSPGASVAPGKRLKSLDRRRQIVRVASALLAERGVDHVRMPEVAEAAGVTRAVIYRFFPSRKALLAAVLEDFREELERRFGERTDLLRGSDLDSTIRGFVEALCDAIDDTGAGGFVLLNMDGPEPDLARLSRETRRALNDPWIARVANVTGGDPRIVAVVSEMGLATSRAVLMLYIERKLSRDEAMRVLGRAIRALLAEFRA